MTGKAALLLLGVGAIWGSSYLFIRIAVEEDVSPLQLVLFRTLPGAVTLLAISKLQRRPLDLNPYRLRYGLLLAVIGVLGPFLLTGWAQQDIGSGPAAVLNSTLPLFVGFIAAAALPDERLTPRRILGLSVGLGGVLVLVGGDLRDFGDSAILAQLAMLASAALYAVSAVISRVVLRGWHPAALSAVQVASVALLTALPVLLLDTPGFDYEWDVWLAIASLSVLSTGVAYVAYYWLIENAGAVRASLVAYIIPIVGVTAGAIVLDEHVGWNTLLGGGVILLGVAIVNGLDQLVRARRQPIAA